MKSDSLTRLVAHVIVPMTLLVLSAPGCSQMPPRLTEVVSGPEQRYEIRKNLAHLQERKGNLKQALQMYSELHQLKPQDVEICQRMGIVFQRLGRPQDAVSYFMTGLRQEPHNSALLADFGYALLLQNDLQSAEFALRQAIKDDPANRRAVTNLAMVLGHQGRFDESYSLFKQVGSEAEANANLAYIHVQRGEGREAVKRYSRALTLDSNLTSAANALVQIAEMRQRTNDVNGSEPLNRVARTEPAKSVEHQSLPSAPSIAVTQAQHELTRRSEDPFDPFDPTSLFDDVTEQQPQDGSAAGLKDVSQTGFQLPRPADNDSHSAPAAPHDADQ